MTQVTYIGKWRRKGGFRYAVQKNHYPWAHPLPLGFITTLNNLPPVLYPWIS